MARPKGTPNTPVAVRAAAVASYKARASGDTRDKVALRFNVADSSLHAWATRTDSATEHEHPYGENTVYVKAPKETPTKAWVRNYYDTNKQMPANADIISTRKHLEPNEVLSASYNTQYKYADRLKKCVLREINQYNPIVRSIGVDQIPRRRTCRPCRCMGDCDTECPAREKMIECTDDTCSLGINCSNRALQSEPTVKLTRRSCPGSGDGMFAAQDIAQGEFIREYVGRIIDGAAYKELKAFGRGLYIMALEGDFYVDAMHWGNESSSTSLGTANATSSAGIATQISTAADHLRWPSYHARHPSTSLAQLKLASMRSMLMRTQKTCATSDESIWVPDRQETGWTRSALTQTAHQAGTRYPTCEGKGATSEAAVARPSCW